MSFQKLFFIICIIPLALTAATLKELANKYESEQKIILVPILVGGITIIIPAGSGMTPDPGEAGNRDIRGIDSDGDGIRDDVERHISLHFQNYKPARAYSYIIAQKYQKIIENTDMPLAEHQNLLKEISQAGACVDLSTDHGSSFTMPYVLNTYERSVAYINGLHKLRATELPESRECDYSLSETLILEGEIEVISFGGVEVHILDSKTNKVYSLINAQDFGLHLKIGKRVQIKVKLIKKTFVKVLEIIKVF